MKLDSLLKVIDDCERVVVLDDNASIDVPPLFKGKAIDCKKHGNIRNGIVKHIIPVGEGRLKGRFDIFVDIEYQKKKGADHEKEKQIENFVDFLWYKTNMYDEDLIYDVAEALVNAGYRKQSEGEWEKRDFIIMDFVKTGYRCTSCNTTWDAPTKFCPNCGAKMKGV